MADVAVFGGETRKRIELGGLTFTAQPVTVQDWRELLSLSGGEEAEWMVKHLRERVVDAKPDDITPEWYDRVTPYTEHQNVANALLGLLENHPSAKGHTILRLLPGQSSDTFSILGHRFMAGMFTRTELAAYYQLPKGDVEARAVFFSACLRQRLQGSGVDPLTITPEWYMGVPLTADRFLELVLVKGVNPPAEDEEGGKKKHP